MSMFKRIVALTMAMITCASFCLVNGGAQLNSYTGDSRQINEGVTGALATLSITEWPQDTGSTDLKAWTLAYGDDYYSDLFLSFTVFVDLGVTLEDYSYFSQDNSLEVEVAEPFAAYVDGKVLLCGEPFYAFIDIESYHFVEVEEKLLFDQDTGDWISTTRYDGAPVTLGMYH